MIKNIVALVLLMCSSAQAGWFSDDSPPDGFMKRKVAVMQHYGKSSPFPITVSQFVKKLGELKRNPSWKKDGKDWILKIQFEDPATEKSNKFTWVIQEEGTDRATIYRFVMNGEEVPAMQLGLFMNQIIIPISESITNGK